MLDHLSCAGALAVALMAACSTADCTPAITPGPAQSVLKVLSVAFEPIGRGKNVVRIEVSNPTASDRVFAAHIQTRSPSYRMGWGRDYFSTVRAGKTESVRLAFGISAPIEKETSIRLRFYAPGSIESYDFDRYFQQQVFAAGALQLRPWPKLARMPDSDARAGQVKQAFESLQRLLRQERYQSAWDGLFSQDYRDADFQCFEGFANAMAGTMPDFAFHWERDALVGMRPVSVSAAGQTAVLSVTDGKETWKIDFVPSEGGWRVDGIAGYTPAMLRIPSPDKWEKALLARTHKLRTEHFGIHYFKGSMAEGELSLLAKTRELGYSSICQFLGVADHPRIQLFLFEDMKTKFLNTGHQGMGLASGDTIVEVYNKNDRLDPYHETTHILMHPLGDPPAILAEGIAVYMSERLGAPALKDLGGGNQALYDRARDLKQKGEWVELKDLLTYTEIGSERSRPSISYAEAGAFVKYLIEKHGKGAFLTAYRELTNSDDPKVQHTNQDELERICGLSLGRMQEDWTQVLGAKDP